MITNTRWFNIFFLTLFTAIVVRAQEKEKGFNELFTEASYHVEYKNYLLALPIYLKLDSMKPNNANIKYRIGQCYLKLTTEKTKAIPYLEQAILNASRDYDDYASSETKAPLDAYYLLGSAYHLNYQLDTAIGTFMAYKSILSKKHFMQEEADHYIEMCKNAKELMRDSIDVLLENLGAEINSPYPDYCPVISADEAIMIFTSRREGTTGGTTEIDGRYMEDVYATINEKGKWAIASSIGSSINTSDHDAAIGLSHDGQILFLYRDDDGDGNIYQSELMGDIWTVPEKLGPNINSPAMESHAALSSDGQTLYIVSDRKGGMGGRDIYRCKKLPDGEWSQAQNLGPVINTKYDEDGPFIQADNRTLYFSSKGHKTMGGFDIFYSELTSEDTWPPPVNIGYPVNTVADDIYFVLSADGKRAYFSSIRDDGMGDLDNYRSTLLFKEATPLTVLKGSMSVSDQGGNPIDAEILVIDKTSGEEISFRPNPKTGKYLIILQPGKDYDLSYLSNGSSIHKENFFIPEGSNYQEIEQAVELKPLTAEGVVVSTDTVTKADVTTANAGNTNTNTSTNTTNTDTSTNTNTNAAASTITAVTAATIEPYQQHFGYNSKDVDVTSAGYTSFIDKIMEAYNLNGKAKVIVEASASKVPTSKFKTNTALAKARGETAKDIVMKSLTDKGADPKNLIVKTEPKVLGPDYKGDHLSNRTTYEKFQYVKLKAGK